MQLCVLREMLKSPLNEGPLDDHTALVVVLLMDILQSYRPPACTVEIDQVPCKPCPSGLTRAQSVRAEVRVVFEVDSHDFGTSHAADPEARRV